MKKTKIAHYLFTALLSLSMLLGAYFELTGHPDSQALLVHLGYPLYFNYILGIAKILGVMAIWQTKWLTLKEWAYAGFTFDLLGAIFSHMAVGDPVSQNLPAIVNLVFLIPSYVTFKMMNSQPNVVKVQV